eukprot:185624_1
MNHCIPNQHICRIFDWFIVLYIPHMCHMCITHQFLVNVFTKIQGSALCIAGLTNQIQFTSYLDFISLYTCVACDAAFVLFDVPLCSITCKDTLYNWLGLW